MMTIITKQLPSVALKMVMREIPHCCQEYYGLQFYQPNYRTSGSREMGKH